MAIKTTKKLDPPVRPRDMTEDEKHTWQHAWIDYLTQELARWPAKSKSAQIRHRRLDAWQRFAATYSNHLSEMHGWKHLTGLPPSRVDLEAFHTRYHQEEGV